MHICYQVEIQLLKQGWTRISQNPDIQMFKRVRNARPSELGFLNITTRVEYAQIDHTGRWLELTDAWGDVLAQVDLREHKCATSAITALNTKKA